MEGKHIVVFIGILAILIILFFALNKGGGPSVSQSTTSHNVTGLDGLVDSIQPGLLTGLGGGTSQGGILSLFGSGGSAGSNGNGGMQVTTLPTNNNGGPKSLNNTSLFNI
jgi:hypothetical protein